MNFSQLCVEQLTARRRNVMFLFTSLDNHKEYKNRKAVYLEKDDPSPIIEKSNDALPEK